MWHSTKTAPSMKIYILLIWNDISFQFCFYVFFFLFFFFNLSILVQLSKDWGACALNLISFNIVLPPLIIFSLLFSSHLTILRESSSLTHTFHLFYYPIGSHFGEEIFQNYTTVWDCKVLLLYNWDGSKIANYLKLKYERSHVFVFLLMFSSLLQKKMCLFTHKHVSNF